MHLICQWVMLLTGVLWSPFLSAATPEKLSAAINTAQSEERPVLSPDGKTLYFYRRGDNFRNLWKSEYHSGAWQTAVHLSALETPQDESVSAVSADGNHLILYIKDEARGWDFYETTRSASGWTTPKNMGQGINTASWEGHGCLSADGSVFLFCSQRQGPNDIFVSFRKNGQWSLPVSLGKTINSDRMEYTPYLSVDGKTLYFSSEGHQPNYGAWDMYASVRQSDTSWMEWSAPLNLGESLNGKGEDYGYVVDAQAQYAYFSKNGDIYRIALYATSQPVVVETPVNRAAEIKKPEAIVPAWKTALLSQQTTWQRLDNVFFERSKPVLLPSSFAELDELAVLLLTHRQLRIEISGHTDNTGAAPLNLQLSISRAQTVTDYLAGKGISRDRMRATGYGEKRPVASNDTEEGRQWNRRVEIRLLKE